MPLFITDSSSEPLVMNVDNVYLIQIKEEDADQFDLDALDKFIAEQDAEDFVELGKLLYDCSSVIAQLCQAAIGEEDVSEEEKDMLSDLLLRLNGYTRL